MTEEIRPPTKFAIMRANRRRDAPKAPYLLAASTSIEDMVLSVRSKKCLKAVGIDTVAKLYEFADKFGSLRGIPNLGHESVKDIQKALAARGFPLRA